MRTGTLTGTLTRTGTGTLTKTMNYTKFVSLSTHQFVNKKLSNGIFTISAS